jgi:hypothetical protein
MYFAQRYFLIALCSAAMIFACSTAVFSNIVGVGGYTATDYYSNPHSGEAVVSFDWSSDNTLYYTTGDPNWGMNFNVYAYDGITSQNIYNSQTYAGSRITQIGSQMYFNDGGTNDRWTYDYFRYNPAVGGAPVKVIDSTAANGSNCWDAATRTGSDLWASGGWSAGINYGNLDADGNLVSQPMINIGVIGGSSGPLTFDSAGNLYYADGAGSNIYRFTAAEVAAAMSDPGSSSLNPTGHVWATIGGDASGGTAMFAADGLGIVLTATSWTNPSELRLYPINGDGASGAYEVLATSADRITEARYHNGTIYAADASGIYAVSVPEPGTLILLGPAMAILFLIRHRRPRCMAALVAATVLLGTLPASAGIYSPGKGGAAEAAFIDAGIAGFVGPAGDGVAATDTNGNYVNPVFSGWATSVLSYTPSDNVGTYGMNGIGSQFANPNLALGPVTGNNMDIVTLGDMNLAELAAHQTDPVAHPLGSLVLGFDHPIFNGPGADFAAFENGFVSNYSTGAGSVAGQMFAELGYVEVSTDGVNFARFPSEYLNYPNADLNNRVDNSIDLNGAGTRTSTAYLTQDVSNIYNLVGKHANAYSASWGTPFNLDDLADDPLVLDGTVNLNEINYVKIVDIPGSGDCLDSEGHPIFDAWVTWGSGGLDFEALGVIHQVPEPGVLTGCLTALAAFGVWSCRRRRFGR